MRKITAIIFGCCAVAALGLSTANLTMTLHNTSGSQKGETKLWEEGNWAPWDSILPSGVIVMWKGYVSSIPAGWQLCDGSGGTPDLRGQFIYGASVDADSGVTGGATSHSHTTPDARLYAPGGTTLLGVCGELAIHDGGGSIPLASGGHVKRRFLCSSL